MPGAQTRVQELVSATHIPVAPSQAAPVAHGKAGTEHPGTQAPEGVQTFPSAQLVGVQDVMHVPLVESQTPPIPQAPDPAQASLQRPSPESQVWPSGHASVVQSAGGVRH